MENSGIGEAHDVGTKAVSDTDMEENAEAKLRAKRYAQAQAAVVSAETAVTRAEEHLSYAQQGLVIAKEYLAKFEEEE